MRNSRRDGLGRKACGARGRGERPLACAASRLRDEVEARAEGEFGLLTPEVASVEQRDGSVVVTVDGVRVGVTLCYDIRFPALYTELADRGAQLITVSASWGAGPGKLDQWTLLARARALDATCFIAAAATVLVPSATI